MISTPLSAFVALSPRTKEVSGESGKLAGIACHHRLEVPHAPLSTTVDCLAPRARHAAARVHVARWQDAAADAVRSGLPLLDELQSERAPVECPEFDAPALVIVEARGLRLRARREGVSLVGGADPLDPQE